MKLIVKVLCVIAIPFLIMVVINTLYNTPTTKYNSKLCTRICHDKGCKHFALKLKDKTNTSWAKHSFSYYQKNIEWLKNNPLGLSYAQMNILVYVIIFPLLCLYLLIRLLK